LAEEEQGSQARPQPRKIHLRWVKSLSTADDIGAGPGWRDGVGRRCLLKGNGFLVSGVVGRKAKILYIYSAALGGLGAVLRPLA
jgi:hypothetical protein